jgi:hypothetical protein
MALTTASAYRPHPLRLILQALVNPHVSSWGDPHRLLYCSFEFFRSPNLPISGRREDKVQMILRPPMQARGFPGSPLGDAVNV